MRFRENAALRKDRFCLTYESYAWSANEKRMEGWYQQYEDVLNKDQVRFEIQELRDCIKFLQEKLKEMK